MAALPRVDIGLFQLYLFLCFQFFSTRAFTTGLRQTCEGQDKSVYYGSSCYTISDTLVWADNYTCPDLGVYKGFHATAASGLVRAKLAELLNTHYASDFCAYIGLKSPASDLRFWFWHTLQGAFQVPGDHGRAYLPWMTGEPYGSIQLCAATCQNQMFKAKMCYDTDTSLQQRLICQYTEKHQTKFVLFGNDKKATGPNTLKDESGQTLSECAALCEQSGDCQGFSYHSGTSHCLTHRVDGAHNIGTTYGATDGTGYEFFDKI